MHLCIVFIAVEIDLKSTIINPSKSEQTLDASDIISDNKSSNLRNVDKSETPHLQLLWKYACKDTKDISCTCLDVNPYNSDLIVGGYGSWKFANKMQGKIMFWTLKNPTNPSRIYTIDSSVVSINFSRAQPHLLACGLFDGNLAVYDIRVNGNEPILKSQLNSNSSENKKQNQASSSKHTTAVWNVLWEKPLKGIITGASNSVFAENADSFGHGCKKNTAHNHRQKLFSIASDGIIKQWSMKKGFSNSNIMRLKRVPNLAALRGSVIDNTIRSREASGLCFDFPMASSNTQYYVGTEDGIVHKCSVSYNEQVLRTYYGHTGPVYRIQCSPFNSEVFLTCSADWTIKIWQQNESRPVLDLKCSSNESVVDCCWSPFDSCIFASSSESGVLSVWNLEINKKDAIINEKTENEVKQIMFATNAPALFSAQMNGNIHVYRLNNIQSDDGSNINNSNVSQNDFNHVHRLNKVLESEN